MQIKQEWALGLAAGVYAGVFWKMITRKNDTRENKQAIWFSSILRWSLGLLFMVTGYIYSKDENAWVILVFGLIIFATGFIRPKRCIDHQCKI